MLQVEALSKRFDSIQAVDAVSFEVQKGDVLGFLGPNGAGKSTTMKMLSCFIPPTEGSATVCGHSILEQPVAVKKCIGYMPENAPLYGEMMVTEFLHFIAQMRELPRAEHDDAVERVIQMCFLTDVRHQPIETLSKGFKRRVSMAQALIHDPEVLILDEPTDGLDPNQKHEVRSLIKRLSAEKCIILSTHILEEVEAVCNRAIIINHGSKCFDGSPAELKQKSSKGKIEDVFRALTTSEQVEGVSL